MTIEKSEPLIKLIEKFEDTYKLYIPRELKGEIQKLTKKINKDTDCYMNGKGAVIAYQITVTDAELKLIKKNIQKIIKE